jgi:hypothetical protein
MHVLKVGEWIFAEPGGPWATKNDAGFRAFWEVPEPAVAPGPHLVAPPAGGLETEPPPVTVKCFHCNTEVPEGTAHVCPQMEALSIKPDRFGPTAAAAPVLSPVPGTETVELPHPAVDGPNPTETEADLHKF